VSQRWPTTRMVFSLISVSSDPFKCKVIVWSPRDCSHGIPSLWSESSVSLSLCFSINITYFRRKTCQQFLQKVSDFLLKRILESSLLTCFKSLLSKMYLSISWLKSVKWETIEIVVSSLIPLAVSVVSVLHSQGTTSMLDYTNRLHQLLSHSRSQSWFDHFLSFFQECLSFPILRRDNLGKRGRPVQRDTKKMCRMCKKRESRKWDKKRATL
jgi:hypothetical protein